MRVCSEYFDWWGGESLGETERVVGRVGARGLGE